MYDQDSNERQNIKEQNGSRPSSCRELQVPRP